MSIYVLEVWSDMRKRLFRNETEFFKKYYQGGDVSAHSTGVIACISRLMALLGWRSKTKAANSSKSPRSVGSEKSAKNQRQQILQKIQDQLPLKNPPKIKGNRFFKKSKISCLYKIRQKSKATDSSRNPESVASDKSTKNDLLAACYAADIE